MTIEPLTLEQAEGTAKELLNAVEKKLGRVPNFFRVLAKAPAVLSTYLGTSGNLHDGTLDGQTGELIAVALANKNSCDYCLAAHTAIGQMVGLSVDELAQAQGGEATDPKAQAAVTFALAVNESHGVGIEAAVSAAKNAGLSETEILEIIAHVGLNIMTNAANSVAKTDVDFPEIALKQAA